MFTSISIEALADYVLFAVCIFLVLGSIFISFKMKFVQLRFFPTLMKTLKLSFATKTHVGKNTISPFKALFTAMSTTLGIGTIVGPVVAIHFGGPGALLGFLITAFFGSAATFTEVNLAVKYRKKTSTGVIQGGPMQYLKEILSPAAAKWYAVACCTLMTAWSCAQSNQLAAILDSPLFGDFRIPTAISGVILSIIVMFTLLGGIKRLSSIASKLVPIMFVLYIGACLWILFSDLDQLQHICKEIVTSAFSPMGMASGTLVGGIVSAMRWGVFKGTQATEAGIGTQSIPHSMAETKNPIEQGMLAMLSSYTAGIVAFLSGAITLMTNTWQDPDLPLGISMVAAAMQHHFSSFGIAIIAINTLLFGFGTILGNSYNGSQCFSYLTNNKKIKRYFLATSILIFFGCISSVKAVWSMIDIVLAAVAVPHMAALVIYAYKHADEALGESKPTELPRSGLECDDLSSLC